jgi:hypothetical protein
MDYVTRQFINLVKKFRKESRKALVDFKDAIEKNTKATEKAAQAQEEQSQTNALIASAIHEPQSSLHEYRTAEKTNNPLVWIKLAIEVAMLFIVAAYASVSAFQLIEVQRQTNTAQQQFEAMDRPWVVVTGPDISFDGPVVYNDGVTLPVVFSPRNVGRSPAQNIWIESKIVPGIMGTDVSEERNKLCEAASKHDQIGRYFLIPKDTYHQPFPLSMSGADNDSLTPQTARSQGFATLINAILIGCIDYTYESSPRHHQTAFAYDVLTKNGLIPAKTDSPFRIGSIILRAHPRGCCLAN